MQQIILKCTKCGKEKHTGTIINDNGKLVVDYVCKECVKNA